MDASNYFELCERDVGRRNVGAFGRTWPVSSFIGRVLPGDVGKRVYLVGDILQVENDEQRAARLSRVPCAYCGRLTPPEGQARGAGIWHWPDRGRVTSCYDCGTTDEERAWEARELRPCVWCGEPCVSDDGSGNWYHDWEADDDGRHAADVDPCEDLVVIARMAVLGYRYRG